MFVNKMYLPHVLAHPLNDDHLSDIRNLNSWCGWLLSLRSVVEPAVMEGRADDPKHKFKTV